MNKYELIKKIERFAPPETQEKWDCSGWLVETDKKDVNRVMLCLTVTEDIVKQAKNCDMIISHHPLFFVPLDFKGIDIYCAHTNLDLAQGGTTDTLIDTLFGNIEREADGFVRYVKKDLTAEEFLKILKKISPNLRYTNNNGQKNLHKIAFCAGSGSEFISQAAESGADAFVTGDIKFHTALESPILLFDIGHFESEIMVLKVFERLINKDVEVVFANEHSPFCQE